MILISYPHQRCCWRPPAKAVSRSLQLPPSSSNRFANGTPSRNKRYRKYFLNLFSEIFKTGCKKRWTLPAVRIKKSINKEFIFFCCINKELSNWKPNIYLLLTIRANLSIVFTVWWLLCRNGVHFFCIYSCGPFLINCGPQGCRHVMHSCYKCNVKT